MKQLKTILFSLPFVLAAVGCSQDELLSDGGKGTGTSEGMQEVEITFDMGTSTALQTRSVSRPVVSSDNWQRVNNVRIYLFKHNGKETTDCTATDGCGCKGDAMNCNKNYELTKIENKDGSLSDYLYVPAFEKPKGWGTKPSIVGDCDGSHLEDTPVWGDDEKDNEQHTFTTKIRLCSGARYKFLAVGRDDIDENNPSGAVYTNEHWLYKKDKEKNPEEGEKQDAPTALYDIDMTIKGEDSSISAKELFSGVSPVVSVPEGITSFTTTIEMRRNVPGFLLYVVNVPVSRIAKATINENGTNLVTKGETYTVSEIALAPKRLSRSVPLVKLLTRGVDQDKILQQIATTPNTNFRGVLAKEAFSLRNWDTDEDDDYYIWKAKKYTQPHLQQNSLLNGDFTAPMNMKDNIQTTIGVENIELDHSLYIVFYTNETAGNKVGVAPIDWIPVKIKSSTDGDGNVLPSKEASVYNFYPNHFYSVGKRNYGRRENDPIDLKEYFEKPGGEGNEIVITVHPNWEGEIDIEL